MKWNFIYRPLSGRYIKNVLHFRAVVSIIVETNENNREYLFFRNPLNTNSNTTWTPTRGANKSNSVTKSSATATSPKANTTFSSLTADDKQSNTRPTSPASTPRSPTKKPSAQVLAGVADPAAAATPATVVTPAGLPATRTDLPDRTATPTEAPNLDPTKIDLPFNLGTYRIYYPVFWILCIFLRFYLIKML